jgi:repressor LexA
MIGLPLMGRVAAGHPVEAIEDPEWVQVPGRLARGAAYALRVQGDSMRDEQIEDGDLVLLDQRTTAEDGDSVVALIDDGLATLKCLYRTPEGLRLQPANPDDGPLPASTVTRWPTGAPPRNRSRARIARQRPAFSIMRTRSMR